MAIFTVVLTDGTRGKVKAEHVRRGDEVTVLAEDENGATVELNGEVAEVLVQSD